MAKKAVKLCNHEKLRISKWQFSKKNQKTIKPIVFLWDSNYPSLK